MLSSSTAAQLHPARPKPHNLEAHRLTSEAITTTAAAPMLLPKLLPTQQTFQPHNHKIVLTLGSCQMRDSSPSRFLCWHPNEPVSPTRARVTAGLPMGEFLGFATRDVRVATDLYLRQKKQNFLIPDFSARSAETGAYPPDSPAESRGGRV